MVWAPAHTDFHASCFSSTVQLRANASRAGRSGSRPQSGSSIHEAARSLPRYSTGGVGGVGGGGLGQTGAGAGGHTSGSGALATTGSRGAEAQPARIARPSATAIGDNEDRETLEERRLAWVFLEIVAALAVAVAIVWWTVPKKPKARDGESGNGAP
jgi:hypothetical protein